MSHPLSDGALSILRNMRQHNFNIRGNPTKDRPWFYTPIDPRSKIAETLEMPPAKFCLELIEHGMIHLKSAPIEGKSGVYTMSEGGQMVAEA
jgi:hypothetical protein